MTDPKYTMEQPNFTSRVDFAKLYFKKYPEQPLIYYSHLDQKLKPITVTGISAWLLQARPAYFITPKGLIYSFWSTNNKKVKYRSTSITGTDKEEFSNIQELKKYVKDMIANGGLGDWLEDHTVTITIKEGA